MRRLSAEPEALQLVRGARADMATKGDIAELRSEVRSLRANVAADIVDVRRDMSAMRKEVSEQIVGLRRAVVEDYTSAIGRHSWSKTVSSSASCGGCGGWSCT